MPESIIQLPPDSTGKKTRSRQRVIGANTVEEQYVLVDSVRVLGGVYSLSSFRTLGAAATPQNIFTLENPAASGKIIAVRQLELEMDSTAVLATVAPSIKLSRPTALPTGGTTLTAVKRDTAYPNASAIARGGTASDGGVATAITATAGASAWTELNMRLHTAVGQVLSYQLYLVRYNTPEREHFILREGEALLVQGVVASAATTHFVANVLWEEFTLP